MNSGILIPKRPLGKTGEQVTIYGLGGLFTVARHDRHEAAVEIVNRAIDLGVNYIDTSALYGNGASELNIGTVMKERRGEVFLATKSHDYTYDGPWRWSSRVCGACRPTTSICTSTISSVTEDNSNNSSKSRAPARPLNGCATKA